MNRPADRPIVRRLVLLLGLAVAALFLGRAAVAAVAPRVENPHGKFREDCQLCHNAKAWKQVKVSPRFDHSKYGFPLEGAHATSNCMGCHRTLDFAQSRTICASCHQDPHHGEMGIDCARCHGARSFVDRGPMVRAHAMTRFPLSGGHAAVDCASCHRPAEQGQMQFRGTSLECRDCHMSQYQSTRTPDHVAGGFPTDCKGCHATGGWNGATFNHDLTHFPLTGAHRATACVQCHKGGSFKALDKACASCHQADYTRALPPHSAAGFPAAACASCHTTTSFQGASFDHAATHFPLTGAHAAAACAQCHGDGVYTGKNAACYSCHATTYGSATPPHTQTSFPTAQCASCHGTSSWSGGFFNHSTSTSFPLTGAHTVTTCIQCHGDGVYAAKSTACYSCHASTYASATPTHTPASFPSAACASCHTTSAWNTPFNHTASTSFPLTGAHTAAACAQCHGDAVYNGKSTACYSCHTSTYASASPPHTSAAFPTAQCAACHGTSTWSGGLFNHATNTSFPLTGAHIVATCVQCHGDGVYAAKSKDCYSCHAADYTSATPPHNVINYPPSGCACHSTATWTGATSHDHAAGGFPQTGQHGTPPRVCLDCHATGYVATSKECYSCHAATYASASPAHTPTRFPTATTNCIGCHPAANTGHNTWSGATFPNHTWFPITSGRHAGIACMNCHNNAATLTSYSCAKSCHTSQLAGHPARSGFSLTTVETQCYVCHPTGRP